MWVLRVLRVLALAVSRVVDLASAYLRFSVTRDKAAFEQRVGDTLFRFFSDASGTFIKFGQILSMRPDLLPGAVCDRLARLLDSVPPESFALVQSTLLEELGARSLEELFVQFDRTPLAAASFATVYRAQVKPGSWVAVKVQRSSVRQMVSRDVTLLRSLAWVIDTLGILHRFRAKRFVDDFAAWTVEELDYLREARAQSLLRNLSMRKQQSLDVPEVIWSHTSGKVLVTSLVSGSWVSQLLAPEWRGSYESKVAARLLFMGLLEQAFEWGVFHGDPHAGNACLTGDASRLVMIDFGILGYLSKEFRELQLGLLRAIAVGDTATAVAALSRVLVVPPDADMESFSSSIQANIRNWTLLQQQPNLDASKRSAGALLLANFAAAREAGVYFTSEAARYYRMFIVLDSVIVALDGGFDHRAALADYLQDRQRRITSSAAAEWSVDPVSPLLESVNRISTLLPAAIDRIEEIIRHPPDVSTLFRESYITASRYLRFASRMSGTLALVAGLAYLLVRFAMPSAILSISQWASIHPSQLVYVALGGAFGWAFLAWASRYLWINAYTRA